MSGDVEGPLNYRGQKVLYLDPENEHWDSTRPWFKIPREQQTCRRCYSDCHETKECKLKHETCSREDCGLRNHHPLVCRLRRPDYKASPVPKKDQSTNRGASRAEAVSESWREANQRDMGSIDALRDKISELKEGLTAAAPKPEKAEWEKMLDRLRYVLTEEEKREYSVLVEKAAKERDVDLMQLILHRVTASRSGSPQTSFVARERAGGIVAINLSWRDAMARTCIWVLLVLFIYYYTGVLSAISWEWYIMYIYARGVYFTCVVDPEWDNWCYSNFHRMAFVCVFYVANCMLALSIFRFYRTPKLSMSQFLVEHRFDLLPAPRGPEHDVNNRHPIFRYGKTLEAAEPVVVSHQVVLYVNGRSPRSLFWKWTQALFDGDSWRKLLHLRRRSGFQYEEFFWVPVETHEVRGFKNLDHRLKVRGGRITNLEDVLIPVGPNIDSVTIDRTRFDALCRIPNIAAARTWDDMMRNVEVAVRTANWEAENWRAYDPQSSINLVNLCAYRWLSSLQSTRKVLRNDVQWNF